MEAANSDTASNSLVVNVDLVNVLFTAKDVRGRLISAITPQNIKLFEDNRLQTISFFTRENDLPLTIGLLIDTSNSIMQRFSFEKATALEFLNHTLQPVKDRVFLMTFGSDIHLIQEPTGDFQSLADAIGQIHARGATKLYDATIAACDRQFATVEGRKVLILISDGDDTASVRSLRNALKAAQNSDVMIYAVSTNPHRSAHEKLSKPDKILQRLAHDTGGSSFFPPTALEFAESFETIANELRSLYSLDYNSTNLNRDGTFRKIKIVSDHHNWVLKVREGYFAPGK
jgi:VWFA-related protein